MEKGAAFPWEDVCRCLPERLDCDEGTLVSRCEQEWRLAERTYNDPQPASVGSPAKHGSLEAAALGVLVAHPDWTNAQIAKEVGCHVKSLSRLTVFCRLRQLLRDREKFPRGFKDREGTMDAW
jgi:hypothetical protein